MTMYGDLALLMGHVEVAKNPGMSIGLAPKQDETGKLHRYPRFTNVARKSTQFFSMAVDIG